MSTEILLMTGMGGGGTEGGPELVAGDKRGSEIVGVVDVPAPVLGTPMTYMVDGEQYIAFTVRASPPKLVAVKLPNAGGLRPFP